ncbi:MAG: FliM/FliN family flagellar motor switch protein [Chlamydiales bacterium]
MNEFTPDEIEGIVKAISEKPPKEGDKIPLLSPGNYGAISKVIFNPIDGEKIAPLSFLSDREKAHFDKLKVNIEVVFGRKKISLKELAAIEEGSLLPLDDLCDDLVEIHINGIQIGRGEVVAVDGQFGVKIVNFIGQL